MVLIYFQQLDPMNGKPSKRNISENSCVPSCFKQAKYTNEMASTSRKQSNVHSHNTRYQKVFIGYHTNTYRLIYELGVDSSSFNASVNFSACELR